MKVIGQLHALAVLAPGNNLIEDWAGPRASQDAAAKRKILTHARRTSFIPPTP